MRSDRRNKAITLFGETLYLAERDAFEALELQVFVRRNELDDESIVYLLQAAKTIEAALKFNWRDVPIWRPFKKLRIWRKTRSEYILKNLQVSQVNALFFEILELENLSISEKKKERESGEMSPEA